MTAQTNNRALSTESITHRRFTLADGNTAYQGALAAIDIGTGKVVPADADANHLVFGTFAEKKIASGSDVTVNVRFHDPIEATWYVNGSSIAATDIGTLCYVEDDQTVTTDAANKPIAGRVWGVETARGVLVQILPDARPRTLVESDPGAFATNDLVIAANPAHGSVYEIPATAAASTVTLPTGANAPADGTELTFIANGTDNGHTVQYRDADGPANITTALTASKRHMVKATYLNGAWAAIAYVSP